MPQPPALTDLLLAILLVPTFMTISLVSLVLVALVAAWPQGQAEDCGWQAGGALCSNNLCCSQWGWCGSTDPYCGEGCQSQCSSPQPGPVPPAPSGDIISRDLFEQMLPNRNNAVCPARGFYTYEAYVAAASAFPGFGTTGDDATRKRELAAFFGQSSHETNGGAASGPFTWGYCYKEEIQKNDLCDNCCPCASGRQYYGRGPLQLSWNYNYIACGNAIGVDLLNNPDLAASDPIISFKTALWFWMTPQSPKPSCHDVMIGKWQPSEEDSAANRLPGFGMTTNIINGGLECGSTQNIAQEQNRRAYYGQYCSMLGVDPGENLDCLSMRPYGLSAEDMSVAM